MPKLPCHAADAAHTSFQFVEDLSTAYWFSETLFAALELTLFDFFDEGPLTTLELAQVTDCDVEDLGRVLRVLAELDLVKEIEGCWHNGQIATLYLVSGKTSFMGDFLLYRKVMQPGWQSLLERLRGCHTEEKGRRQADDDYAERTYHYVRATDQLMRQKATEIAALLNPLAWRTPMLEVGGAAGSLCRALLQAKRLAISDQAEPLPQADLLDLPEVLTAARKLYPDGNDWQGITSIEGDFRFFTTERRYGLIVLSNFLHIYAAKEAETLLGKAVALLREGGVLLIHDYFPDRHGPSLAKGALYDLAMMLNTYNGHCHTTSTIRQWLQNCSLPAGQLHDLSTDSSLLLTVRGTKANGNKEPYRNGQNCIGNF